VNQYVKEYNYNEPKPDKTYSDALTDHQVAMEGKFCITAFLMLKMSRFQLFALP